jgi:hypothetical protein
MTASSSRIASRIATLVAGVGLLSLGTALATAAETSTDGVAAYTWFAELVAYDAPSHTATLRARIVAYPDKPTDFSRLHAGDSAMLTWSGVETAVGIRAIEPGKKSSFDRMTLPIEYVSSDDQHQFVTFKVRIPAKDAGAIAKLKPGDYVTATSPLTAANAKAAVSAIGPYSLGLATEQSVG